MTEKTKELKDKTIGYIKENRDDIIGMITGLSILAIVYGVGVMAGKAKQLEKDNRTMTENAVEAYTYGLKDGYRLKGKEIPLQIFKN